VLAPTAGP